MNAVSVAAPLSARATIAVMRETNPAERRVGLVPADVRRLAAKFEVLVEEGSGTGAGFSDAEYLEAGAKVLSTPTVYATGNIFVGVDVPEQVRDVPAGSTLISLRSADVLARRALRGASISHLVLERMPRITRAQSMDVLSSQAAIAGYVAVLEGARRLPTILPMMSTAAGVLRPASMIALGAGVAGLQALATARRLGAVTYGFDVRRAAREQVESVGAAFVYPDVSLAPAEARGGYARAQSLDEQTQLRRALEPHLGKMNLIVTSAQIPGRAAPVLIDEQTLSRLSPGTVIVDLAAGTGGNTSRTSPDQDVIVNGVTIYGPTRLESFAAAASSRLYSGNVRNLLEYLAAGGDGVRVDQADEITAALLDAPAEAAEDAA